jgi:hypothetical protein
MAQNVGDGPREPVDTDSGEHAASSRVNMTATNWISAINLCGGIQWRQFAAASGKPPVHVPPCCLKKLRESTCGYIPETLIRAFRPACSGRDSFLARGGCSSLPSVQNPLTRRAGCVHEVVLSFSLRRPQVEVSSAHLRRSSRRVLRS